MESTSRNLAAVAGLLLASAVAQAQTFTFTSAFTPSPVLSSQPGSQINLIDGSGTSGVLSTGSSIVLANLTTVSGALDSNPAVANTPWTIELALAPSTAGGTPLAPAITDTFTGSLFGTISQNSALIFNTFNSPTIQTYNFGALGTFTVNLNSFVSPGAPSTNVQGAIGALVTVSGITTNGSPTPEPGALAMLLAAGVPGTLLARVSRKRLRRGVTVIR